MAVNKVEASGGRLTLQGDYVTHHEKHVDFSLKGDRLPAFLKGSHSGDIFITNLRLIFINKESKGYQTFSMDFQYIRNTEVKQPIFGANYISGFIKAEVDGGWEGNANFEIYFPKGGAIKFAERFHKSVKDSLRNRQNGSFSQQPQAPQAQPGYGFYPPPPMMSGPPPPPMAQGGYYYPPPQQPYYQYQPGAPPPPGMQQNYAAPPTGQAPPPYQNNTQTDGYDAHPKSQEAFMNGNTAYVPNEAPPPYNPDYVDKKRQ